MGWGLGGMMAGPRWLFFRLARSLPRSKVPTRRTSPSPRHSQPYTSPFESSVSCETISAAPVVQLHIANMPQHRVLESRQPSVDIAEAILGRWLSYRSPVLSVARITKSFGLPKQQCKKRCSDKRSQDDETRSTLKNPERARELYGGKSTA